MFALTYYSQAASPLTQSDLFNLAQLANKKNQYHDITGFLLYKEENFIQYLEGREDQVLHLMDTIKDDPRHEIIRVIHLPNSPQRRFEKWNMRYWTKREMSFIGLYDLLDDVFRNFDDTSFEESYLITRVTRLVNHISKNQQKLDKKNPPK